MGNGNSNNSSNSAARSSQPQRPQDPPRRAGSDAPPGAYSVQGTSRGQQQFYVTIPRGVQPGQHFAVLVNGQQMMVRCPPGNGENDRLIVTAPRQQSQQYVVTVPPNIRPGEQFRVLINTQEVMVTCPRGVRPGQRVTFQLPEQERAPQPQTPAPNHQMFEVAVPENVVPGQAFALIANGQRVMVTCPPNVRPGQKIRFQLPVQLSQQQLEMIRVNYDKDGWMRCLGQDLKFHWVYNKSDKYSKNKKNFKIPFDIESNGFVRQLRPIPGSSEMDLVLVSANEHATDTTVRNTSVNYHELTTVSSKSFKEKTDWLRNQFNALRIPWEQGHIKIKLRRTSILQDSMEAIESITAADMMKTFRFEFIGEPGLDAGGVAREWYQLVSESLFNPDCGLFLYSSVNQMCMQINPNSGIANELHLKYFHFVGRMLGKALMENHIPPVHLIQPLYKHLMGWPVTLHDLECIDEQVHRNLILMLDFDDVSSLYLDFSVSEDHLGVAETVNLIPNGVDIPVTNDNIGEYLDAQLRYRLLDRVKDQLREMVRGFYDVVPEPLLSVFDFQELELILHGLPVIDMSDWMVNTIYSGDFSNDSNHIVVQWFWEIVRNFDQEKKARLLQFATGTCGVPSMGFGYLQGNDGNIRKFCLHGDKNVKVFPRSHTCFNRLDMPLYTSKQEMQKFLTMAISLEASGFDIE